MMQEAAHAHEGLSYRTVFLTLLVLTAATVGAYAIDFGHVGGIVVAMAIASLKATLVALYFMHLRFEVRSIYIVVGVPLVLTLILVVTLVPDIGLGLHN